MTSSQECTACGGKSSLAARFCQWCGEQLRELQPFETSTAELRDSNTGHSGGSA